MARLIVLQGEREAALAWSETWKVAHPEGVVFDEKTGGPIDGLEMVWDYVESAADVDETVLFIPWSQDTIEVLDFAEGDDA